MAPVTHDQAPSPRSIAREAAVEKWMKKLASWQAGKLPNMKRAWGVAAESSLPLGPWDPGTLEYIKTHSLWLDGKSQPVHFIHCTPVCHIHAGAEDGQCCASPEVIVLGSELKQSYVPAGAGTFD
ncbi:hypothetical protein C2857_005773 [Epichloe festucae Fl1]|uniref:Uncharacterized protein n=1 Tax=Epichloe festucae (strain Fl1) TaxID=877507 RepID=A0A7S9PVN7_EPIFF|nr:hypothetical protein C2857_005773 [Epichloe festucae Fl1]